MIAFTKMHGLGNDYLYVNCFQEHLDGVDIPALARAMSDRHRGVGSDGLILIKPHQHQVAADVCMEMYNADGSRGEMCGNGIRCVAKYVVEHGLVADRRGRSTREVAIQTDRGVLKVEAALNEGRVTAVRVNMGEPILRPSDIPVRTEGDRCIRQRLPLGDVELTMTCVSMGNPHAVIFVDALDAIDLTAIGPHIERHALFPNRVNVHLVTVNARDEATMRTWERGSGLTQACGTGACAVLVAGVLEGRLDRRGLIHLPGGDLEIEWAADRGDALGAVFMTGPAEEVFTGQWPA